MKKSVKNDVQDIFLTQDEQKKNIDNKLIELWLEVKNMLGFSDEFRRTQRGLFLVAILGILLSNGIIEIPKIYEGINISKPEYILWCTLIILVYYTYKFYYVWDVEMSLNKQIIALKLTQGFEEIFKHVGDSAISLTSATNEKELKKRIDDFHGNIETQKNTSNQILITTLKRFKITTYLDGIIPLMIGFITIISITSSLVEYHSVLTFFIIAILVASDLMLNKNTMKAITGGNATQNNQTENQG